MLAEVIRWLGLGLCHQLPERSFSAGGVQLPVCARDTGIYIGVMASILVIWLLQKGRRPSGFPSVGLALILAGFIGAMALDGITSYAGLRTTTNDLRLLTGLSAGYAIGALVVPIVNGELFRRSSSERVLEGSWRVAVWVASVPAVFALLRWGAPFLQAGYAILTALCIIATFGAVNLAIVSLAPPFERSVERMRDAALPLAVALALTGVEHWIGALLRLRMLDFATSFQ
ncbi:MAG: DUF2085 domain-containing protein [Actinomycetota bacterium]|nr:DUF2085 domain-containing protein [Actinomycetota bacterium]